MYIVVYDVIASLARQHPLLYVLEDLHFADAASLDLLWFLTSRASRVPILFLLAQRLGPGSPEPKPSRTNFSQLVLEPLSDEEAARIVEAALDWIPDELRDRIVARAGGNPFFIEESLRSLVESGAAEKDASGEWHLHRASCGARSARDPARGRGLAHRPAAADARASASSSPRSSANASATVCCAQAGGDRLAAAVDQLIAADLVLEAAPGERREGRYRFKHAIVQEVAYNTLLVRRRMELHRRVAAAYEAVAHRRAQGVLPRPRAPLPDRRGPREGRGVLVEVRAARHRDPCATSRRCASPSRRSSCTRRSRRIESAVEALYLIARVRRYRGENDAALAAYERALLLLEARDPKSGEVAILLAHMAELCTRWDAKHPDLDGLIERGLAIVGTAQSRERVLLLAAKSFMPRRGPKSTDADWEASLATAKEALAIAEELGLLRERSALPRRGRLRVPRARQLPRGVSREPAPAADRPVPAGQRRAHRRAHDGRDLRAVARRYERGDGACRERARGRDRDGEAAARRARAADRDARASPRRRLPGHARRRGAPRAIRDADEVALDARGRDRRGGRDGLARREDATAT